MVVCQQSWWEIAGSEWCAGVVDTAQSGLEHGFMIMIMIMIMIMMMMIIIIIYPGRKSRDFKNYKKSVKLERPLNPRELTTNNTVVQQN